MPLQTVEVPQREGRVCYLTTKKSGRHITVECPGCRTAYGIHYNGQLQIKIGDWVRFRGEVRRDTRQDEHGLSIGNTMYYHDPHDGSEKTSWIYEEMRSTELSRCAPPEVSRALREASDRIAEHLNSWDENFDSESLFHTISAIDLASSVLKDQYMDSFVKEKDMCAPITSVDLDL